MLNTNLSVARWLAVLAILASILLPARADTDFWESGGAKLTLYPKERQVAEGSALPMRLKADCKYTCPDNEASKILEAVNSTGATWRVNGIAGGNAEVGKIRLGPKDEHGRVTEVTYIAPDDVPDGTVVDISATINHIGYDMQVQYVSHVTILSAANWSGWVHVSFKGMKDEYDATSADRNWEWWKDERPEMLHTSPSLRDMQIDISWLEFEVHHTITDSMSGGEDDVGESAMLVGGVSGELHYYNRTQAVGCTDWSYTALSGSVMDYGPMSRPIPYTTAMKVPDGKGQRVLQGPTMSWIPGVVFEIAGKEVGEVCEDGYYVTTYSPEYDNFGTAPEPIEDTDPTYGDACLDTYTGEFDQTVRFRGEDIQGKTTISWCLNRR